MVVVLDTNHLSELLERSIPGQRLEARLESCRAAAFVTIITLSEAIGGWQALLNKRRRAVEQVPVYSKLQLYVETIVALGILPFDEDSARIYEGLAAAHRQIGTMDLKIAAICKSHDVLLLTRNLRDFKAVVGLRVENWLD